MNKVIALYIRLSDADIGTGKVKNESESITNQRSYLNSYIKNDRELSSYNCIEYVDDGYTGTNGNRPNFQEMIQNAREGKIHCIVVKDLSRFFRDYTEAGNYLECVFPFLNIRFISINENYDSSRDIYGVGTFDIAIRNIIHTAYSKELSEKVKRAKKVKREKGEFSGVHAPFGYKKTGAKGEKLEIDDNVSGIIRELYYLAIQGMKSSDIARTMNERERVTPAVYYLEQNPTSKRYKYSKIWTPTLVRKILLDQVYQGDMVLGKREVITMGKKETRKVNPTIIMNTHKPIVTRKEADKAIKVLRKNKPAKIEGTIDRVLKSKVKCGCCKRMMGYRASITHGDRYICGYKKYDSKLECSENFFGSKDIEKTVYNSLLKYFEIEGMHLNLDNTTKKTHEFSVAKLKKGIKELETAKFELYEQYTDRKITGIEYREMKKEIDKRLKDYKDKFESIEESTANSDINPYYKIYLEKFQSVEELTREMVEHFVEMIYVSDDEIEIKWKFGNVFDVNTENT